MANWFSKRLHKGKVASAPAGVPHCSLVDLEAEGFPARVANGFLDTATTIDSVVASRCPNKPAKQLIDDGHALKSFYIHAKSCDWGPMAGFVCQLPPLNKKGPDNAGFNLEEHVNSIAKFKRLADASAARHPLERAAALAADGLVEWPFAPIAISRQALDRLFDNGYLDEDYCSGYTKANHVATDPIAGCAWNGARNTLVEFVMRRMTVPPVPGADWWAVLHRQIWVRSDKNGPFTPYLIALPGAPAFTLEQPDPKNLLDRFRVATDGRVTLAAAELKQLDKARTAWLEHEKTTAQASTLPAGDAYPLRGAQNPYPPYDLPPQPPSVAPVPEPVADPRNAVSGDYDLFAIWPHVGDDRWDETVRLSERESAAQSLPPPAVYSPTLFHAVPRRRYTAGLSNAPAIRIEVIPGFKEITAFEDPILGNINDAVGFAVGTLNSAITHLYDRRRKAPNAAFHSDEGGRPGVNEIEYPVAVFLPASLREPGVSGAVVLRNHQDFLSLLEWLKSLCDLPLNFGWLMHLLLDGAPTSQLKAARDKKGRSAEAQKKLTRYFDDRLEARDKLSADALTLLQRRSAALLTGRADALDDKAVRKVYEQAVQAFIDVACLQLDPDTPAADMVKCILESGLPK